jgi:predicted transcriptional regulator
MLAHFVERQDLSPDDVQQLEQILARRKKRR